MCKANEFAQASARFKKTLCLLGSTRLVKSYNWVFGVCWDKQIRNWEDKFLVGVEL